LRYFSFSVSKQWKDQENVNQYFQSDDILGQPGKFCYEFDSPGLTDAYIKLLFEGDGINVAPVLKHTEITSCFEGQGKVFCMTKILEQKQKQKQKEMIYK
jgi:hypothetical protein